MKKIPPGVYSVLLTPLKNDGGVDEKSFKYTVRHLVDKKVHGLVVLGSTGEMPYISLDDRKKAIDAVVEEAGGKVPVVVGAGAFGTDEVLPVARHAERQKADALLVPLPVYYGLKFDSVLSHYRRIADEVSLPVIYYHFPEVTRLDLKADQLARLFEIKNIVGIKESIFDLRTVRKHKKALPKDALVFSGTILTLRPVMKMGGSGCICPIPNLIPETCVEFYESLKQGDRRTAEKLEKKIFGLLPVFADVPLSTEAVRRIMLTAGELGLPLKMGGGPHAALKEALRLLGHPITPAVKSPLPPITEKQKKRIFRTLNGMNLISEQETAR